MQSLHCEEVRDTKVPPFLPDWPHEKRRGLYLFALRGSRDEDKFTKWLDHNTGWDPPKRVG